MRYKPFNGDLIHVSFYIKEDISGHHLQLPTRIGVPFFKEALPLICDIPIFIKSSKEDLQYLTFDSRIEHKVFIKFVPGCPYYDVVVEGEELAQKICDATTNILHNRDKMIDLLYCFSTVTISSTEVKINLREDIYNYIGIKIDDLVEISNVFAYSSDTSKKIDEMKYKDRIYVRASRSSSDLEVKFFIRTLRKIDDLIERISIGSTRYCSVGIYAFCKTPLSQQVEIIKKQE
jgi:hypothetical protein